MDKYNSSFHSGRISSSNVSQLEREWQRVLEDERKSHTRNKKLLEDFDRVEKETKLFSRKSDSLKHAKQAFEQYVSAVYPKWNKELQKWREAKAKKNTKDLKQTSSLGDGDFTKELRNSTMSLGDSHIREVPPTKPVFSSTPYVNGVQRYQDPAQFLNSVRNEQPSMTDHRSGSSPYGRQSDEYPKFRMDSGDHWGHGGYPPGMFGYVPRYPFPREYDIPWRNNPYSAHPGYMIGPAYGPHSMGNYEGFPQNSDRRNAAAEERFREYQKWNERFGHSFAADGRDEQFHEESIRGHPSERRDDEHRNSLQKSKSLSEERFEIKGRLEETPDLQLSPGIKDIVENGQIAQPRHRKSEPFLGHRENSGKNRKPDNRPGRGEDTEDSISDKMVETFEKPFKNSKLSARIKGDMHPSMSDSNVEIDQFSGAEDQSIDSSSVNPKTWDISSEIRTDKKSYKAGTDSVSLPTIHNFEGNLKDFYSSDTEQTSDFVGGGDLRSKSDDSPKAIEHQRTKVGHSTETLSTKESRAEGTRRTENESSTNELRDKKFENMNKESSRKKDEAKEMKNSVKESNMKEPRTTDILYTTEDLNKKESAAVHQRNKGGSVETTKKKETTVLDDLVGDDASDFEVSGLEESDIDGDDGEPLGSAEISKHVQHEPGGPTLNKELEDTKVENEVVSNQSVSREEPLKINDTKSRNSSNSNVNSHENKAPLATKQSFEQDLSIQDESLSPNSNSRENEPGVSVDDHGEKESVVDEESLLTLLRVVDDDIEVSFSTELLYRHHNCTTEQKLEVIKASKSGEGFAKFDPAVISMVILDHLPHLLRTSSKGCLISDEMLTNEKKYLNENDIRKEIDTSLIGVWKKFFSHFQKMIQYDVMVGKKIADIFAPCLVSSHCSSVDKAVSLLSRILSSPEYGDHVEQLSANEDDISGEEIKEKSGHSKEDILTKLSFSSEESPLQHRSSLGENNRNPSKKKNESKDNLSYSEDFEEEKSIPLTETDAYQKMLNSMKMSDEGEDNEEDLLEETISEANTSGQLKYGQSSQQQIPTKSSKSKPKLSLFSSGEVDELGDSFNQEGGLGSSWKSSEASLSPPLSPELDTGYVPTVAGKSNQKQELGSKISQKTSKTDQVKPGTQESDTKARIQAGFWNNSESESEVDLQVSHGAEGNNDDEDDFDFYS